MALQQGLFGIPNLAFKRESVHLFCLNPLYTAAETPHIHMYYLVPWYDFALWLTPELHKLDSGCDKHIMSSIR